jgi:hypothetical protein
MAQSTSRDDFSEATKQLLARRAGFRCSICQEPTVGPHSQSSKSVFLGEASHIYSAAVNGPRANPALTPEQRSDPANGIHLCKVHARLIDVDTAAYSAERLKDIKFEHEQAMRALLVGQSEEFDPEFLIAHESQVVHGRGSPSLSDLWIPRQVTQPRMNQAPAKVDATTLVSNESGVVLILGEQWTGRTSLLKRMAAGLLGQKNCVWIDGREIAAELVQGFLVLRSC